MKATNFIASLLEFVRAPFARRQAEDISKIESMEERVRVLEAEIKGLKSRQAGAVSGSRAQACPGQSGKGKS